MVSAVWYVPERLTSICISTSLRAGTIVPLIVGFFSESILADGLIEGDLRVLNGDRRPRCSLISSPLPGAPPVVETNVKVPRSRTGRVAE